MASLRALVPCFCALFLACSSANTPNTQDARGDVLAGDAQLDVPDPHEGGEPDDTEVGDAASPVGEDGSAQEDASGADDASVNDGGLVKCDQRAVQCKRARPTCAGEFEVPEVIDGCYGECVRIDRCACSGPEDCPDENQFTCFRYASHCGPYVR